MGKKGRARDGGNRSTFNHMCHCVLILTRDFVRLNLFKSILIFEKNTKISRAKSSMHQKY